MFGIGTPELIGIIVLALFLFGGKKLPELARGLGQAVREFNTAKSSVKQEIEEGMRQKPTPVQPVEKKEEA